MKKILVSINGQQDPIAIHPKRPPADGPILSLLAHTADFDEVILFYTRDNADNARKTAATIETRYPGIGSNCYELEDLDDPTDYGRILTALRRELARHCPKKAHTRYQLLVSSGTPQMHACWLLLVASGEFKATLLQQREKRFVKNGHPLVNEIDPRTTEYPLVKEHLIIETIAQVTPRQVEAAMARAGIIASDPRMKTALEQAANTAWHHRATILILGPSGTGKELMARFVWHVGQRQRQAFKVLNCGAISEKLIESELFGHVKGAFTGADRYRKGIFESCDGGTVFLDEIGEMPLAAQVRLLRVLDQKEVVPVGSSTAKPVDVQIVAATNRDLVEAVRQKQFREDLYYRLCAHTIHLPPLKHRRDDIARIAGALLEGFNQEYQKPPQLLTADAIDKLRRHDWPGNVRELKNVIERTAFNHPPGPIGPQGIHLENTDPYEKLFDYLPNPEQGFELDALLVKIRRRLYDRALALSKGNLTRAGALLGKSAEAVRKHRNKHGIG